MSIFKRIFNWFKLRKLKKSLYSLVEVQKFQESHPREDVRFVDRILTEVD